MVDAEVGRDGLGRAAVVAGDHRDLEAERVQRADGLGRAGLDRVGHGEEGGGLPVDGGEKRRAALRGLRVRQRGERAEVDALALEQPGGADADGMAVHRARHAHAGLRGEALHLGQVPSLRARGADDGLGHGVFRARFERGDQRQHAALVHALCDLEGHQLRAAFRQRAGLVEGDDARLVQRFAARRPCGRARPVPPRGPCPP
jgi:hypothetical protein